MPKKIDEDFCRFVALASIPLRDIDEEALPIGISSGCLVDYGGHRWILTVAHSTGNMRNWTIEVGYEAGCGTKLYRLGQMRFTTRGNLLSSAVDRLDMAYSEVPPDLQPRWQPSNQQGQNLEDQFRTVFRSNHLCRPDASQEYGFAGNVQPTSETHFGARYLGTHTVCYTGLKFVGEDDDFHFFRLPCQRPEDDFLKGTSGSPICGADENVVALVCGPGREPDTIRGVKISHFRHALDVELAHEQGRS